ncbi:MAG: polysaccharide deacetylase family protein [Gaiellaceae bacterium]
MLWLTPAPAAHVPRLAARLGIPLRLSDSDVVALTFDDGPHPEGTPAILETLAQANATATFFLVGEQVERFPATAASIAAAGHEIALHGQRHVLLLRRRTAAVADDLARAAAVIEDATGQTPRFHRPPYGVYSAGALALVRDRWTPMLWSTWGRDWERHASPQAIARRATDGLRGGDVVLLHDADHYSAQSSWRRTAAAMPSILEAARRRGLTTASLSHAM